MEINSMPDLSCQNLNQSKYPAAELSTDAMFVNTGVACSFSKHEPELHGTYYKC